MLREFAEYLFEFVATPWGPLTLVLHGYLESFIVPGPHDIFLIALCLAVPKLSFVYALMSTVSSVAGIATGYGIGRFGGRKLLVKLVKPRMLVLVKREFHKYHAWAMAIACFTPLPIKVFALAAGAFGVPFKSTMIVSFFSRAARFFLISTLFFFYGERIKVWVLDYMNWVMIGIIVFIIIGFVIWHFISNILMKKNKVDEEIARGIDLENI